MQSSHHENDSDCAGPLRAAVQEFNLNSRTSVSKELVRMLKLSFAVQFVAPDSCALRPLKHPLKLSLEPI